MKSAVAVLAAASVVLGGSVVDLGHARYEGFVDAHNITNFLGIRYAAAPIGKFFLVRQSLNSILIGNLRWQAPASPPSVPGIQQSTSQPAKCYQSIVGNSSIPNPVLARRDIEESEDCLFLSVYSPSLAPTKLLPTLVWIHGGGYALGAASDYNGTELALESNKNIVVVVLQYRLGLFGFLAGDQVHEDGVANAGLLDQDFALRWINKNIEKFGGDPNRVTIWGQSAGAGSVLQHVLANSGKTKPQLFRYAMTSSTYIPPQYPYNHWVPQVGPKCLSFAPMLTHGQALFNEVAELTGCPNSTTLACLRDADAETLQTVNIDMSIASYFGTLPFTPVVDGTFIVENPIAQLSQGKVNGEAYYAVTNTNEGVIFVDGADVSNATAYACDVLPALTLQQDAKVAQIYASLGSPLEQAQTIMKELEFVCPSFYALAAFPGKSYKVTSRWYPAWFFTDPLQAQFTVPPALHGDDIAYYFPSFDGFGTPTPPFNNTDFINAFVGGFLSFTLNGNPNDKLAPTIAPTWPVWSNVAAEELVFNKTDTAVPEPAIEVQRVDAGMLERCEFWKQLRITTSL
ncbi:Carboxylic ester hydrolase [Mycena chlorophos]|uniref:Carboxylic ester hydrolase n=1 Tax=Mycena chlorophos TaxID=658473 RepID=A0A8H6VTD6_MYCCL|nr:Carboxylic ester hydrolase [Mycena chlorophos]